MKKSTIIIGVALLVVIIGGAAVALHKKPATTTDTSSTTTSNAPIAATITYSSNGFSPTTITVKSGDTVAIKNTSSETMQLDSDPHPVHTDDVDLNVGTVTPGQTKTFVVTKKGSFGYHNHLDPSDMGHIVIQ